MSSTETVVICPQCGASNGMTLASGDRLCFECRHEWQPNDLTQQYKPGDHVEVREAEVVVGDVVDTPAARERRAAAALDLVLGPPDEIIAERRAQAAVDDLTGRKVELEGGQVAWVRHFPDDDHVTVSLFEDREDDELVTVPLDDVVRELPPAVETVDVPDETGILLAKGAFMVAGLALNAGLATLEGDGADYTLVMPPNGWAPDDPDALPLFEQGVGYAIATLIFSYQLPRDMVAAMAETLLTDAQNTPDV